MHNTSWNQAGQNQCLISVEINRSVLTESLNDFTSFPIPNKEVLLVGHFWKVFVIRHMNAGFLLNFFDPQFVHLLKKN